MNPIDNVPSNCKSLMKRIPQCYSFAQSFTSNISSETYVNPEADKKNRSIANNKLLRTIQKNVKKWFFLSFSYLISILCGFKVVWNNVCKNASLTILRGDIFGAATCPPLYFQGQTPKVAEEIASTITSKTEIYPWSYYPPTAIGMSVSTASICVAVNTIRGISTVALDNTGQRILPTYVAFDEEKEKCGQVVIDRLQYHAESTVYDTLRMLGKKYDELKLNRKWPFKIINDNNKISIKCEGKNGCIIKTPEEVTASLLKHAKKKTEEFRGKIFDNAVITVPLNFNKNQIEAMEKAALLAGWKDIYVVPESIATMHGYFDSYDFDGCFNTLLVDLGGGSIYVSIFEVTRIFTAVKEVADNNLGGNNFDQILYKFFKMKLGKEYGVLITGNKKYKLMSKCQKLKEDLSVTDTVELDVEDFDAGKIGFIPITQKEFRLLSKELLDRVKINVLEAFISSGYHFSQIDKVLLVGGGSRMPVIKNLIQSMFPYAEYCEVTHPEEITTVGAVKSAQCMIFKMASFFV